MKRYLIMLLVLAVSYGASRAEEPQPDLKIHYNSSGLTVISLESNRLECTWHTFRKDLNALRTTLESYDKHQSSISLIPSEADELLQWARKSIKTKVTDDQKKSKRGYYTALSVSIDGKTFSPNHDTVKAFKKIVSKSIKDRRKEEF